MMTDLTRLAPAKRVKSVIILTILMILSTLLRRQKPNPTHGYTDTRIGMRT